MLFLPPAGLRLTEPVSPTICTAVMTTTCTHLARPSFPTETRLEPAGFEHLVFGRQTPAAVTSWLPQTSAPTSDDTSAAGASNMLHSTSPIPQPLPAAFRTEIDSLALLVCALLRFVQDLLLVYDFHVDNKRSTNTHSPLPNTRCILSNDIDTRMGGRRGISSLVAGAK